MRELSFWEEIYEDLLYGLKPRNELNSKIFY
jgi:hypothetical protein